ncbi:MAG: AraC family transcriptional regulator [Lachnospiraceae bacterium]|jgi:AraC family cel operon transcriptional repressor|nr:AraC family transcriptional regulator [Lachnospiraceae bacterium]
MTQNEYCIRSDGLLNNRTVYTHIIFKYEDPGTHCHDFIEFFYVLEGECLHLLNGKAGKIASGDACLLTPNDIHAFQKTGRTFLHRDILFQTDYFRSVCNMYSPDLYEKFTGGLLCKQIKMTGEQLNQLEQLVQPIALNPDLQDTFYPCAVCTFIITAFLSRQVSSQTQYPAWITKLISLLSAPENFPVDQQVLIRSLPYSQEYICRTFKKLIGKTVTDYFNEQKMRYAYTLLQSSSYSVEEICDRINFNNVSYFYRLFKKSFHMTPRQVVDPPGP